MRVTIEFDSELWRVRSWWHRRLCAWFGHPRFEERGFVSFLSFTGEDNRPRCVRCRVPDPSLPKPWPVTYTFPLWREHA